MVSVFYKQARARFGDLPSILFTGKGREAVVIEALNNGADVYLQKGGDIKAQFAELTHKITKAAITEYLKRPKYAF
jgi:DNA-binding NarL/FixJ family response regulator